MNSQALISKVIPEMITLFEKRYTIIRTIYANQPIGRRTLSAIMGIGERIIRSDTAVLKDSGLIDIRPSGMVITKEGEEILDKLREYANALGGINELERRLESILRVKKVVIVPGELDIERSILLAMGKAAAVLLDDIIYDGQKIAVTGGSSLAATANALVKHKSYKNISVLPARGGIGKEVEYQSNTVASIFAKKLGGQYRLLHLPDQLSKQAAESLLDDAYTKSVINDVKQADVLVCGIGRAEEMAEKRNLSTSQIGVLRTEGAVAEAFGHYFNNAGQLVLATSTIGLQIKDLKAIPKTVGVAGGRQKAEAIIAVLTGWENCTLVTDESAAREIIKLSQNK
ncbi:MAG TPA: sugar-binding domain-containing protein [Bacillota bacterium]|nr:sugar-binding domain-containing protein [Bacillota bacterium]